ncbi:HlyD family secretion protein [Parapedobacter koreensis]|uniref:HlyD family secretion protein n=1 Tax=Parapedobacter koreensis TaxID=332977 RepID=A0A1H7ISZ6_9SPHI|nr:HlyD family efflux transporter periplasmic adaptor subunit [Parapedobacter koreensis]SEK65528.1 HlyD family secretion protein [Parapedobacter koreensis]
MKNQSYQKHSEAIQEIIGKPPSTLLKSGTTIVLLGLLLILGLSAIIRYPDIIRTEIRINSSNSPKPVVNRISGNIVRILFPENEKVDAGQPLAWLESTADHNQVLELSKQLYELRIATNSGEPLSSVGFIPPTEGSLGELQEEFQVFYQSYLSYKAATEGGIYLRQRTYINRDLENIKTQQLHLEKRLQLYSEELKLAEEDFERYKVLAEKKVISPSEYQQKQSILISKQYPLQETRSAILSNESSYTSKIRELSDLENTIQEEKSKFIQALNSLISATEQWKSQYLLTARQQGRVSYAGIIQENQHIDQGQTVFYINPGNTDYFGEAVIPQYNMGKVRENQKVHIKLLSFPFEEYGIIKGTVGQVSSVPHQDSLFISKIILDPVPTKRPVQLRTGLKGTAEIITEDASLLMRLIRNLKLIANQN